MRIDVRHGLDLSVGGSPRQVVQPGPRIRHAALRGPDYIGLKPALDVAIGDSVRAGQALFHDRRYPEIRYCAPIGGTVSAVNRGARRRLLSVVVRAAQDDPFADATAFTSFPASRLAGLSDAEVAGELLGSGLWTALRRRPFDCVPAPDERPAWMFITAIDTDPLAPDPAVVIRGRAKQFIAGVTALSRLSRGRTFVCTAASADVALPDDSPGVVHARFAGRHPAGLPGTHIHLLARVGVDKCAWHIGYQDVIAIGSQLLTGKPWARRIVSLAGPGVTDPRLVEVPIGAHVGEMLAAIPGNGFRTTAGSALAPRAVTARDEFLGRYERQVQLLRDAEQVARYPGPPRPHFAATGATRRSLARVRDALRDRRTGLVPVEAFDRVWPMRIAVVPLLRALLVKDIETAESLGCLAFAEEDLALCRHVCPAGLDYPSALRTTLAAIEAEI